MDNPAPTHNGIPLDITPDPQAPNPTPIIPQTAPAAPATKESEPNYQEADKVAKEEGDQYWESYAREIELEKAIAEMGGVEKVESGEVKLPEPAAREMGIQPTVTIDTPIAQVADFTIRGVALTDEQLGIGLTKPTSSGFRWLVEWFIYQLLKAHYLVKKAHGKIFRGSPSGPKQTSSQTNGSGTLSNQALPSPAAPSAGTPPGPGALTPSAG